jgi:glutathione S-transferase
MQKIKLYRHPLSGHCHRVELFMSLLGLPYETEDVDLAAGAHKAPDFLELNAFGQVPVVRDGDLVLADSNAILLYLAERYAPGRWWPSDPVQAAAVQRWLSAAAGDLASGPATARLITVFGRKAEPEPVIARAHALFKVIEGTLGASRFIAGDNPTIADIALYSYTAHAPEGNVSLEPYPRLKAWLARIEALPGFVPMARTPVGLQAQRVA